jgi:hypothetical protein
MSATNEIHRLERRELCFIYYFIYCYQLIHLKTRVFFSENNTCLRIIEPLLSNAHSKLSLPANEYRGADKSLARPECKQATATEDFEFHISYLCAALLVGRSRDRSPVVSLGIFFRGSFRQNHVPWGRLSLWKWVPGISPGVKAAGVFGWQPTTLVVPEVEKIRGLNLPGTPWATSACRGIPLLFYILFIIIIWGILVLFTYIRVTRLASNEIFSPSNKIH